MRMNINKHIVAITLLFSSTTYAIPTTPATESTDITQGALPGAPFISMNIGVEINGLEQAAHDAAEGVNLIGASLQRLADRPDSSPELSAQIARTLSRIDQLSESLNSTVKQLPETVERGLLPVEAAGAALSTKINHTIVLTAVALVLIILFALAIVYYFVLAPATRSVIETTQLLNELADTLNKTADIVEIASERNLEVMRELKHHI